MKRKKIKKIMSSIDDFFHKKSIMGNDNESISRFKLYCHCKIMILLDNYYNLSKYSKLHRDGDSYIFDDIYSLDKDKLIDMVLDYKHNDIYNIYEDIFKRKFCSLILGYMLNNIENILTCINNHKSINSNINNIYHSLNGFIDNYISSNMSIYGSYYNELMDLLKYIWLYDKSSFITKNIPNKIYKIFNKISDELKEYRPSSVISVNEIFRLVYIICTGKYSGIKEIKFVDEMSYKDLRKSLEILGSIIIKQWENNNRPFIIDAYLLIAPNSYTYFQDVNINESLNLSVKLLQFIGIISDDVMVKNIIYNEILYMNKF